jgi:hypothetical protein
MMVLNFASPVIFSYFTKKLLELSLVYFYGFVFVISYYFLNINTVIVGASAAIMTILVAVTPISH